MPRLSKTLDWLYSLEGAGRDLQARADGSGARAEWRPPSRVARGPYCRHKGKGSVAAMIDAIPRAAGQRCGLYTKPHLVHLTKRTRIDGGRDAGAG